jgi:hypothetical protein
VRARFASLTSSAALDAVAENVARGAMDPYSAADRLFPI